MVAHVNREMFANALYTPALDPSDSDEVRLALETARVLEAQGDAREATRWIRRAADAAEKDGKDERVVVLARAAADLTSAIASVKDKPTAPSSVPTLNVRGRGSNKAPRPEPHAAMRSESPPPASGPAPVPGRSIPPMLAALISSIPPFSNRPSSAPPPAAAPPPASATPPSSAVDAGSPAASIAPVSPVATRAANDAPSTPVDKPLTARTMRIGSVRVAIKGSFRDAKAFSVERLEKGEPVPAGAMEAMLVLTGDIDGSIEIETNVRVADDATKKLA